MGIVTFHPKIEKCCEDFWASRDFWEDQKLFKKGGEYHVEGHYNAKRCWLYQLKEFIQYWANNIDWDDRRLAPIEDWIYCCGTHLGIHTDEWVGLYKRHIKTNPMSVFAKPQ